MQTIHTTRDQVAPLVAATFPGYRGKKFRVEAVERVTFFDLNWSGGSRSEYRTCDLLGKPLGSMDKYNQIAPWDNPAEGKTIDIPQGACIVRHSIFQGRDTGLTLYMRPEDMPNLLPPAIELTPVEKLVLFYTATKKSSYNGRDRYQMACDDAGYGDYDQKAMGINAENFPTRNAWEEAKQVLAGKGLLNKRGAITDSGRNAIGR